MLHENLIFIIGSPRSGSTLLQRMLGSHSDIYTHPEPHLLTPLNYLGYYETVHRAPYDHINAAQAQRELIAELPRGEDDYLDALRAYASTIYERVLQPTSKTFFLDKTPAYGLVLPFIARLYPRARYVVLTRHPMAIHHSVAHSFFGGDYQAAQQTNPIVSQYVPAIGAFLREAPVDKIRVRYEDLVGNPAEEMERVAGFLGLSFEPGMVTYGNQEHITKSYGDPMTVHKHDRPVTDSVEKWASDLSSDPDLLAQAQELINNLAADDVEAWGYDKASLLERVNHAPATKTRSGALNTYRLKRQILLRLRKNIDQNRLGRAVKKVRYYCDVLLRT